MSYTKHAKRDSGFGESLSLGSFNAYLGLSHEKKTKGDQAFIEDFTNKKLEEILPKKTRKVTHDQNFGKPCEYTPFSSYTGLNSHNDNRAPIIIKTEIDSNDSNKPLPSAAEISISRNLQLIREVEFFTNSFLIFF